MNKVKKLFAFLFICMFLISFTSALNFDNIGNFEKNFDTSQYGRYDIRNSIMGIPFLQLGKVVEVELMNNSEPCKEGRYCSANLDITLHKKGELITDFKTLTNTEEGWIEQDIRSHNFYYWGDVIDYEEVCYDEEIESINGTYINQICKNKKTGTHEDWIEFRALDKFEKGDYKVKIEGEKKPSREVDWLINVQGIWTKAWAIWGGNFVGSEYQLSVSATYIDKIGLEINDVLVTELSSGLYKINTSNSNDEISRALIMKTLFYGTTGGDPRAKSTYFTNISGIYSRDIRDYNKRGIYVVGSDDGDGYYTGTFTNVTDNYYVSSWSKAVRTGGSLLINQWEIPSGSVRNSGNSDELGTDTSSDQVDNPTNSQIEIRGTDAGTNIQTILLSTGNMSWSLSGSMNIGNTDFYEDEGFPLIQYSEAEVTLNSPTNNYVSTTNEITFNASAEVTGGATLTNMSLWTNLTGTWSLNETIEPSTIIDYDGTTYGYDGYTNVWTLIKTHTYSDVEAQSLRYDTWNNLFSHYSKVIVRYSNSTEIAKVSHSSSGVTHITSSFNFTRGLIDRVQFWILRDGSNREYVNEYYLTGSTPNSTQTFTKEITDTTIWNVQACDSDGDCGFAPSNYTLFLDPDEPNVSVESPTGIYNYNGVGLNETLNITFTDQNLEECWYNYNGTNISLDGCLSGVSNETNFLLENNNFNMTIYANDSIGNFLTYENNWSYKIFKINQTYSQQVITLSDETFELYILATEVITSSKLNYNGTNYNSDILSLGGGLYRITNQIRIPLFSEETNVTFFYNLSTSLISEILTENNTQEVIILNIGNCTAYSNLIMNLSLFDERTLESINGSIEFDLDILNENDLSILGTLSTIFEDISFTSVCTDINITEGDYLYSLELRYYSKNNTFDYVPEFYHIQKARTSNLPNSINLYDLNINESTEFTIYYRDNTYTKRENVLLQILRKYVDEGIFRVIEIPITSSEGTAIGHFDLDNYKYKIIVTENGVVLNTFDNPTIRCESELSGICTIELKGAAETSQADFVSNLENFYYTVDQTNDSIIIDYSIPSGESEAVNIEMIQTSPFADPTTICNQTLTSSAGSIECFVNQTIGDSQVAIKIISADELKGKLSATFQEDLNSSFLLNNYFLSSLMLILLITMVVSSPTLMVLVSVFGVIILGLIFLLKASSIGLIVGAIGWLIVAAIIIGIKINSQAEQ